MDIIHIIGLYMFNDIGIENCSDIRTDVDVGGGVIIYRTLSLTALTRNASCLEL